jgi:SAM-dependent methyltransferase
MYTFLKRAFDRLGLLGPAFRCMEWARAARARLGKGRGLECGPDGLPLPPPKHVVLVGGVADVDVFLDVGRTTAQRIREVLAAHGEDLDRLERILDFGCGCGRVLRYWRSLERTEIHGTDYNRQLVAWCRKNLPFVQADTNEFQPPLRYADGHFDLIYAISVFTHLPEAVQAAWMREFVRVLKPGGYLMLTVQGDSYTATLTPEERPAFAAGHLVVRYASVAGSNLCAVWHPQAYLREVLGRHLPLVGFAPYPSGLDYCLFRKPALK